MANYSNDEVAAMSPKEFRSLVRRGEWTEQTFMACRGYMQANLAIVPKDYALEFLLFCNRNPRPCPIIDVTEPGSPHPPMVAPEADIRTDLSSYRVYIDGKLEAEPTDITDYWRDDLVSFIIGCSLSFDWLLRRENIHFRFIAAYSTNISCVPAGRLSGHMVVSCRLIKGAHDVIRTIQISSRYPAVHGAPIHIGDPRAIGIKDLPHTGMSKRKDEELIALQEPDEIALFWGCGITPQAVAVESKIPLMLTHKSMFVTDRLIEDYAIL